MKYKVYIFGEMHTKEDRDRVEKGIISIFRKETIKYLLTEEAGPFTAMTSSTAYQHIKDKVYSISDRSYKLGIHLGIPVIGIDNWEPKTYRKDKKDKDGVYTNCKESFKIREERMVEVIKKYGDLGPCVVIVGDSHLRKKYNLVMGDVSPIQLAFADDPNVFISRSPISELNGE